jgi:hypothetical protein
VQTTENAQEQLCVISDFKMCKLLDCIFLNPKLHEKNYVQLQRWQYANYPITKFMPELGSSVVQLVHSES